MTGDASSASDNTGQEESQTLPERVSNVKRGHFVSQGYLKAFADPAREAMIFVLRPAEPGTTFANPIQMVASQHRFYDAEHGDTVQEVENWFAQEVETTLPQDIARFIDLSCRPWYQRLPPDELQRLLRHLALQFLRTPQVREAAEQQIAAAAMAPGGLGWQLMETQRQEPGVMDVRMDEVNVDINGPAHMTLVVNEQNVTGLIQELSAFTWQLRTTQATHPFVTSDAPVTILRPSDTPPGLQAFPLGSLVTYPLTPTAMLFGCKTGRSLKALRQPAVSRAAPDWVQLANRTTFVWAHEQVLGSSRAALLEAAAPPEQTGAEQTRGV